MNFINFLGGKNFVVCAWAGGANTTPLFFSVFSAAYFAKRNLNGGGLQKRGRGGRGVWGEFRRARASGERQRAGGFSKKVRAKDIISPPIETSSFERVAPRGRVAAALRKIPRRFAAKWLGGLNSKRADLSVSYLKAI